MLFIMYLTFCYRQKRQQTQTNIPILENVFKRAQCDNVYCARDDDCKQICSAQYKCNTINRCVQSDIDIETKPITCKREFGFYPILTADEIFQPQWTCLNTRPDIFDDNQEYRKYICAGGSNLDTQNLFDSCVCGEGKIKVRDDFRGSIPLCIDSDQLSLFPNFSN